MRQVKLKSMAEKRGTRGQELLEESFASREGSTQCVDCERYLRLGNSALCLNKDGGFEGAAEIYGYVPGSCDGHMKLKNPFEVSLS
jgi:hypothetical protein